MGRIKRILLLLLIGVILDVLLVGIISHFIVFYQKYQIEASQHLIRYIKENPIEAITSLFQKNSPAAIFFSHKVFQSLYWTVLLFFIIRMLLPQKNELPKEHAEEYSSDRTAR